MLVEGHGESDAVLNLLNRLASECAPALLPFGAPIRVPGISRDDSLLRYLELVRAKHDAHAVIALRDNEDGCPKQDAPRIAALFAEKNMPFPAALVMAYREYESLFLPCIDVMAGRDLDGIAGTRPGLRADATFEGDDYEGVRGVKEWLTRQMPRGRSYKPTIDQLLFTRMVDFDIVRRKRLPWFDSLNRALQFLANHLGEIGAVYPPPGAI